LTDRAYHYGRGKKVVVKITVSFVNDWSAILYKLFFV
jgi:hypothetical protein